MSDDNVFTDAEICEEYWKVERALWAANKLVGDDTAPIIESIEKLQQSVKDIKERHSPLIDQLEADMAHFKDILEGRIPDGRNTKFVGQTHYHHKVHPEKSATQVSRKTTYSTLILDKEKVMDVLIKNQKVLEGVNNFYLGYIKKLIDVGIMPRDAATVVTKTVTNVTSIPWKEPKQW